MQNDGMFLLFLLFANAFSIQYTLLGSFRFIGMTLELFETHFYLIVCETLRI